MTPLAWIGALAIGLTLGLLGSGGSILTVPVLIYLVGVPEKAAIAESLAIVGLVAGGGVLPYVWKRMVSWSTVLLFSLPGMGGAYLGALAATHVSSRVQLVTFAVLMLSAAGLMLRRPPPPGDTHFQGHSPADLLPGHASYSSTPASPPPPAPPAWTRSPMPASASPWATGSPPASGSVSIPAPPPPTGAEHDVTLHVARVAARHHSIETIIVQGFGIGVLTGLVGVGGGFLIVPALVLLVHLPMHMAVGTSLATITLNSAAGFYKHAQVLPSLHLSLDWHIIGLFAALGVVGSLTGSAIAAHVPNALLRRAFAIFLILMSGFLLWKNAFRW